MKRTPSPVSPREDYGFKCWHGSGIRMAQAHTHFEIEANLMLRGSLSYLFGGRRVDIATGEWAIFWGSVPHQAIALDPDSEIYWFTLPLASFLGWELPRPLTGPLLDGRVIKQQADLHHDARSFIAWEKDLASGSAARRHIVELEMEARLRRLALSLPSGDSPLADGPIQSATAGELGHLEKMAAFMAQNYEEPIRTDAVARAAGIHPNYAMNLFKREFGLSIGQFLTRTRLSHAQRLLATTDKTVVEIAFSCGFGSASRFHAAFKEECGQPPAEYRKHFRR